MTSNRRPRTRCSEMAAPPRFCLACGIATQSNARRLLCSEGSATVCQVWSELLGERLKKRRIEVAVHSVRVREIQPSQ